MIVKKLRRIIISLGLVVSLIPATAMAHGAIFTFKYIDGENMIMVTHNVHDAQSGLPITYNMRLYTLDGQLIPFQKVQAEVNQASKTLHAEDLQISPNNDVNLTYEYPKAGDYELSVRFLDNDKQVAQAKFPIAVARGVDENFFASAFTLQTLTAFILGIGVTVLYIKRRSIKLPTKLGKIIPKKKEKSTLTKKRR